VQAHKCGHWATQKLVILLLDGAYDRKDEIAEPYLPEDATSRRIKRVVAVPITIIIYESTAKQNQQQRRCLN
jgi:hypothetical protein